MMLGASYKAHLYSSISKALASDTLFETLPVGRVWELPTGLNRLLRRRPNVIFTNLPPTTWYARLYRHLRRQHIPIIVWLLGDFWREHSALLEAGSYTKRLLAPSYFLAWSSGLNLADRILATCAWLEKTVRERFPHKRTSVLYQGIDPDLWLGSPFEDHPYHFESPAVGILQDNNILPKVRGLLRFSEVVKEMKDVNFYIAGGGHYTDMVKKAYADLPNVHFVGRLPYPDGVRRFFRSLRVYVLASGLDCCPNTLLEASLCRCPVVASRVGGIPELVVEGETGWTIPNAETDTWVDRIRDLLNDNELASRLGHQGQQFVLDRFSWKRQAIRLLSAFKEELRIDVDQDSEDTSAR